MNDQSFYPYLKWLCLLLFAKAVVVAFMISYGPIGLGPDEAQYWTWSQVLDWGYYSKPPGIAWQIWLGTKLFGNTVFGVRFVTLIFSFLQGIAIYSLAVEAGVKPKISFWCALVMALSPMGILGSLMTITDGGMLLFWTLACIGLVRALHRSKEPNPQIIGAFILAAALFKWPAYIFWIFYLICWRLYFPQQRITRILSGVLISLIGLMPSVWWNWTHEWATFRHVSSTIQGGQAKAVGNFFEFIGSQTALISPILFVMLIISFVVWIRQRRSLALPIFFCGLISLVCLGLGITLSLFQKIQGNWVIYAYPTAFIVMGWMISQRPRAALNWIKGGIALSLCMTAFVLFVLLGERINPFKHNLGWSELERSLTKVGYNPATDFLVSDKYQTTSILSFYSPAQKRAYFLNLSGARKNQFSYWSGVETENKTSTGYFVWIENSPYLERDLIDKMTYYQEELQKYFHHVEFAGFEVLQEQNFHITKGALFFKCRDCYQLPQETSLW